MTCRGPIATYHTVVRHGFVVLCAAVCTAVECAIDASCPCPPFFLHSGTRVLFCLSRREHALAKQVNHVAVQYGGSHDGVSGGGESVCARERERETTRDRQRRCCAQDSIGSDT